MGDTDYERFCREYAGTLGRIAYLLVGHRESARDLAQDVLLDAYRSWPRVAAATDRNAYVRRMLVNRHMSSERRRQVAEVLTDRPDAMPADPVEPPDAVADQDAIWRALGGLSERQRAVLVLRHYEGLDDTAIAAALGCRRSSVRSLATRALAALRESPHVRDDSRAAPTRRTR